jgi:hypothetical protein
MVPPEAKAGSEPTPDDKGIMELIAGLSPWAEVRLLSGRRAARCAAAALLRPPACLLRVVAARRAAGRLLCSLGLPRPGRHAGRWASLRPSCAQKAAPGVAVLTRVSRARPSRADERHG